MSDHLSRVRQRVSQTPGVVFLQDVLVLDGVRDYVGMQLLVEKILRGSLSALLALPNRLRAWRVYVTESSAETCLAGLLAAAAK